MGAILAKQGSHDYSGLQIFSGISCVVGGGFLIAATCILGKSQGSRKV